MATIHPHLAIIRKLIQNSILKQEDLFVQFYILLIAILLHKELNSESLCWLECTDVCTECTVCTGDNNSVQQCTASASSNWRDTCRSVEDWLVSGEEQLLSHKFMKRMSNKWFLFLVNLFQQSCEIFCETVVKDQNIVKNEPEVLVKF